MTGSLSRPPGFAIRRFRFEDGRRCHAIRRDCFRFEFSRDLSPEEITAGGDVFTAGEFAEVLDSVTCFVATQGERVVGFAALKELGETVYELLYLYVDRARLQAGIGSGLLQFAENWLKTRKTGVRRLQLDNAVPCYNRRFYEKHGYSVQGESNCRYRDRKVPAVRMAKKI